MSLFWGGSGDCWEPEGGERREWRDLQPGDLVVLSRKVWRVREARLVPVVDWDEHDRERFRVTRRGKAAEEDWQYRPLYLILLPASGGERHHVKVRPWSGLRHTAWVLHPHYPVCSDCGEPWPCPEIGITREARRQSAELERLSQIMPGCCWACGEPVTARQSAIVFEGENLLLPGGPPPVFHLRAKGGCRGAAMGYEDRWAVAGEGRPWRLQCPGKSTWHVDGPVCDRDQCPGPNAHHAERATHVLTQGGTVLRWAKDCARCADAAERDGFRWFPDDEVKALLGWARRPVNAPAVFTCPCCGAGTVYAALLRRGIDDAPHVQVEHGGPGRTIRGGIPAALERIVSAVLAVTMPGGQARTGS